MTKGGKDDEKGMEDRRNDGGKDRRKRMRGEIEEEKGKAGSREWRGKQKKLKK